MQPRLSLCLLALLLIPCFAENPDRTTPPERPRGPVMRRPVFLPRAGMIFAATILRVERVPVKRPNEIATIAITCRVDRAIRGVRAGRTVTLREWAGLWIDGPRYAPGQRLMLLLYAPSRLGLTSPISGMNGRLVIDDRGRVHVSPPQGKYLEQAGLRSRPATTIPLDEFVRDLRQAAGREQ